MQNGAYNAKYNVNRKYCNAGWDVIDLIMHLFGLPMKCLLFSVIIDGESVRGTLLTAVDMLCRIQPSVLSALSRLLHTAQAWLGLSSWKKWREYCLRFSQRGFFCGMYLSLRYPPKL
jgi:hypothetical protein